MGMPALNTVEAASGSPIILASAQVVTFPSQLAAPPHEDNFLNSAGKRRVFVDSKGDIGEPGDCDNRDLVGVGFSCFNQKVTGLLIFSCFFRQPSHRCLPGRFFHEQSPGILRVFPHSVVDQRRDILVR